MASPFVRSGIGLHGGKPATLELVAEPGPLRFERDGVVRALGAFYVENTQFSTTIACDAFRVRMVEHLFAALAGLGIRDGLRVVVTGEELPLLDGSAGAFVTMLGSLTVSRREASLTVAREETLEVGGSRYDFVPGAETLVEVEVELPPSCAPTARWAGDAASFVERIAASRTFVLERDIGELERLGLAQHASPESVLVVSERGIHGRGEVPADEPARHKLVDLVGDAYFYGGPPRGTLRVRRPGHARNHLAFTRALDLGVLARDFR